MNGVPDPDEAPIVARMTGHTMTDAPIPDEAMRAALDAWNASRGGLSLDHMRAALAAAQPALARAAVEAERERNRASVCTCEAGVQYQHLEPCPALRIARAGGDQ